MVDVVMATLLHFFGSLAIALLVGFMLSLSALVASLSSLAMFKASPAGAIAQPLYRGMREFLAAFGGGSCWDGTIAIALTVGVVSGLWHAFSIYKHKQRDSWRLVAANASTRLSRSIPKL